MISRVIAAWRTLFMYKVRPSIMSLALRVAESIAVMRAACSDAAYSRSARKIWLSTCFGRSSLMMATGDGSYR